MGRGTRRTMIRSGSTWLVWELEMGGCHLITTLVTQNSSTRLDLWMSRTLTTVCLKSKPLKISSTEEICTRHGNHGTTNSATSSTRWTVATTITSPSVTLILLRTIMRISATC